jgi:lysocardiolipin and lysophospholipid acyltransferase
VIAITVLFAPTSLIITTDAPPSMNNLVERDSKGRMTKINLPDRLVVMANHQAYTDWMYLWILACYSGHSTGVIILLKEGLKKIPVVGWGMVSLSFHISIRSYHTTKMGCPVLGVSGGDDRGYRREGPSPVGNCEE